MLPIEPSSGALPTIPRLSCGLGYPLATLDAFPGYADSLIAGATTNVPSAALKAADAVSRRWLARAGAAHLDEIDRIAERLARPGAYFLSINYEWGCTVALREHATGPELVRILDWRTPGLGRYIIAANVDGPAGPFETLTWPGYTGILQANAPGRFAAAINQAPMPKTAGGLLPLDWLSNKIALWRQPAVTPAHLLREVFETAPNFAHAATALSTTPIASPVIYSLIGCKPGETAIIERVRDEARIHRGPRAVANVWTDPDWSGHPRGKDNHGRKAQLENLSPEPTRHFAWLAAPVLNPLTRLAASFSPADGRLIAQGFEAGKPATKLFEASPHESA